MGVLSCVLWVIGIRCFVIVVGQSSREGKMDYLSNLNGLSVLRKEVEERKMTLEQMFLEAVEVKYASHNIERIIAQMEKFCKKYVLDWAIEPGEEERYMITICPGMNNATDDWSHICAEGPRLRELIYLAVSQAHSNIKHHGKGKVISFSEWKGKHNG